MKKRRWDTSHIPDQSGRIALVTGANSGLGFYTSLALAARGARVILACRNVEKGEAARKEILRSHPGAQAEVRHLDLAGLSSVRHFSEQILSEDLVPDILVNNAGLMAIPYRKTEEGFEMQFGVNHLGHFALTALLWPSLSGRKGSRVINVSSSAHRIGDIRFSDIHWEKSYRKWKAYGMSKLANILFTRELARQCTEAGIPVIAAASHPGYAGTELQGKGARMEGSDFRARMFDQANRMFAQSAEMGALPTLFAAASPEAEQGAYYGPDGFMGMRGWPEKQAPGSRAMNDILARELWELSEELTGISFRVN